MHREESASHPSPYAIGSAPSNVDWDFQIICSFIIRDFENWWLSRFRFVVGWMSNSVENKTNYVIRIDTNTSLENASHQIIMDHPRQLGITPEHLWWLPGITQSILSSFYAHRYFIILTNFWNLSMSKGLRSAIGARVITIGTWGTPYCIGRRVRSTLLPVHHENHARIMKNQIL